MRIVINGGAGYADELKGIIYNYAKSKNIPADVQIFSADDISYEQAADISIGERIRDRQRENEEKEREPACLIIKIRNSVKRVPYRSILYFSKDKHYTEVHAQKETVRYLIGFRELTEGIPEIYKDCFVQCYRSIIVNLAHVKQIDKDTIHLVNDEKIPVSQTYAKNVRRAFEDYFAQPELNFSF